MHADMLGTGRNWSRKSIEEIALSLIDDGGGHEFEGDIWVPGCSGVFKRNPNYDDNEPQSDNNQPMIQGKDMGTGFAYPLLHYPIDPETSVFGETDAYCVVVNKAYVPGENNQNPKMYKNENAWWDVRPTSIANTRMKSAFNGTLFVTPSMTPKEQDNSIRFNFKYGQIFYMYPNGNEYIWVECTDTDHHYIQENQDLYMFTANIINEGTYKQEKAYKRSVAFIYPDSPWQRIRRLLRDCSRSDANYARITHFAFTKNKEMDKTTWVKPFVCDEVHNAQGGLS